MQLIKFLLGFFSIIDIWFQRRIKVGKNRVFITIPCLKKGQFCLDPLNLHFEMVLHIFTEQFYVKICMEACINEPIIQMKPFRYYKSMNKVS